MTLAIQANEAPIREKPSVYPEPFFSRMAGRSKRPLGDLFSLKNFGVNLTALAPGGESSLMHRHSKQDEFVYVLQGTPTLATEDGEQELQPGMCVSFAAGGLAHHLINKSNASVVYLEIGDRSPDDIGEYPQEDLVAKLCNGAWIFTRKNGDPYT